MRRIVIWLASTVTVVVLLFGYHTSTNKTTSGTTEGRTSGSTTSAGSEPSATPSSPSSGSSSSSTKIATYTGPMAQTRWGPVQVKITVQGGRLTKVTILQQPSGNSRDAEINNYALPILINETVTAQSTNIDMVSARQLPARDICNRCRLPSTRQPLAKARWRPVQVKITVHGHNHRLQLPSIDMVSRTTMTSWGYVQSLQPALGEVGI
jgi:uncharacterized protein with FMN-binding domain